MPMITATSNMQHTIRNFLFEMHCGSSWVMTYGRNPYRFQRPLIVPLSRAPSGASRDRYETVYHIVGPTTDPLTSRPFDVNRPSHSWNTATSTRASGEEAPYARGLVVLDYINMESISHL